MVSSYSDSIAEAMLHCVRCEQELSGCKALDSALGERGGGGVRRGGRKQLRGPQVPRRARRGEKAAAALRLGLLLCPLSCLTLSLPHLFREQGPRLKVSNYCPVCSFGIKRRKLKWERKS